MQLEHILYGGDYNPEQWLDTPEILERDIELFKIANINTVSIGMFSWSTLEPREGEFHLDYMEEIINRLHENGISVILSTPTAARPKWMSDKYEEVLRVDAYGDRYFFGGRHNHCYTSPVYREKTRIINTLLSERFGKHPGVIMWHISNEYGGECYCPLCQQAFREWLKKKYGTIDVVNKVWNNKFWSHEYNSFNQVEAPSPRGEMSVHGLNLDWKRFVSDQTIDFAQWEIDCVKATGTTYPTTVNMMYNFWHIDYVNMAKIVDVVSWDSYPVWHKSNDLFTSMDNAFTHDKMRSLKDQPWLLMESCPSSTNWQGVSKLKRPGLLTAASLNAVAHGSDSVLYFQLRQSRGSSEKFHGAVIEHEGSENTRVFRECTSIGKTLTGLEEIIGSKTAAPVAIIYDLDNRWAIEDSQGPRNKGMYHYETVVKNYTALRKLGVNVDILTQDQDFSKYKMVVAPMMYMFRSNIEERIRAYVDNGGAFVLGYWSGIVNETDMTFLGGTPHKLMDVFGVKRTETDGLYDGETNRFLPEPSEPSDGYEVRHLCDLLEVSTAKVKYRFASEFYAGYPAVTKNQYGQGTGYYIAGDVEQKFYDDFFDKLLAAHDVKRIVDEPIPSGVEIASRYHDKGEYVFVQNFNNEPVNISCLKLKGDILYGESAKELEAYDTLIIKREQK